jgi:DNA topoisomerase I
LLSKTYMRARRETPTMLADTTGAAERARLCYVAWDGPGIRRVRRGKGFQYVLPDGSNVQRPKTLERIRSLAIPPAWKDVWICPSSNGHLQATGRDARGRLQYRYHPRWRVVRDEAKYHDVVAFARLLPRLRRRVAQDLSRPKLTKDKVTATVVHVMERTSVRVGNDRYAESNHSYGLTTLLDRHARIRGGFVEFRFRGKGGKPYRAALSDARLAAIVKRCRDIPGQRLFQYVDDEGGYRAITSTDVNEYLRRSMGRAFTAKTFRTWAGTMAVGVLLAGVNVGRTHRAREHAVRRAVERVAEQLGNTAAVCRKSYVHPAIVSAYDKGALVRLLPKNVPRMRRARVALLREERAVLGLFGGRRRRRQNSKARSR